MAELPITEHGVAGHRGTVIILTGGVGAGHDGAAAAWADRLRRAGYDVQVRDVLAAVRRRGRPMISRAYELVLRRAPWVYEVFFRACDHPAGIAIARALMGRFIRRVADLVQQDTPLDRQGWRRMLPARSARKCAEAGRLVAVLATYPLAGQVLGELRRQGRLTVPALTFLTDFSVHPLCVAPGIDAHLAVHPISANQAVEAGASAVVVTGPVVDARFARCRESRADARAAFALPADGRLALLVAGSWGIGDVETTVKDIARSGVATPVVVCGRNDHLRQRISQQGKGIALGWVTDMPLLMRAADVLIENAGGLTSLEAMASDLPVASYRPIAGHGRTNAEALDRAGVATHIRSSKDLAPTLTQLMDGPRGSGQRRAALNLFDHDLFNPAPVAMFESAVRSVGQHIELPERRRSRRPSRPTAIQVGGWTRRLSVALLLIVCSVVVGVIGPAVAVAHGVRSVHPSRHASYLLIRPGADTSFSSATIEQLQQTHSTVAIDPVYARRHPDQVRELGRAGVPIINTTVRSGAVAALGRPQAIRAGAAAITGLTGRRPPLYLPDHRLDVFDLGTVTSLHERVIEPNIRLRDSRPISIVRGQTVLVDCPAAGTCDLSLILAQLHDDAADRHVELGTVTELGQ